MKSVDKLQDLSDSFNEDLEEIFHHSIEASPGSKSSSQDPDRLPVRPQRFSSNVVFHGEVPGIQQESAERVTEPVRPKANYSWFAQAGRYPILTAIRDPR